MAQGNVLSCFEKIGERDDLFPHLLRRQGIIHGKKLEHFSETLERRPRIDLGHRAWLGFRLAAINSFDQSQLDHEIDQLDFGLVGVAAKAQALCELFEGRGCFVPG